VNYVEAGGEDKIIDLMGDLGTWVINCVAEGEIAVEPMQVDRGAGRIADLKVDEVRKCLAQRSASEFDRGPQNIHLFGRSNYGHTQFGSAESSQHIVHDYRRNRRASRRWRGQYCLARRAFWGLWSYLERGNPVFTWNLLDLNNLSGIGRGGVGTLSVDGRIVSTQNLERTIPLVLPRDETFDIGSKTGSPIDDRDYQVRFAFTGKIDKLTISVAPPVLTDDDKNKLMEALHAAQDAN